MADIKHYLTIKTRPEAIYNAITTEMGIRNWWTTNCKIRQEVGSVAQFNFSRKYHDEMKVVDLQPNKRVEWECIAGDEEWIGTTIIFELEEQSNITILRFSHENWMRSTDFFANSNYNWAYYLHSLKKYLENGFGEPFRG